MPWQTGHCPYGYANPSDTLPQVSHFHRSVANLEPAGGVRIHVAGVDLVRDAAGAFRVLERMGARIGYEDMRDAGGEDAGHRHHDLRVGLVAERSGHAVQQHLDDVVAMPRHTW